MVTVADAQVGYEFVRNVPSTSTVVAFNHLGSSKRQTLYAEQTLDIQRGTAVDQSKTGSSGVNQCSQIHMGE